MVNMGKNGQVTKAKDPGAVKPSNGEQVGLKAQR